MNDDEIKSSVLRLLERIAPESDPRAIDPRADLRDALDIDSMDFLRFVVSVHDALHVDIPEADYPKVRTLDGCVGYVRAKLAA